MAAAQCSSSSSRFFIILLLLVWTTLHQHQQVNGAPMSNSTTAQQDAAAEAIDRDEAIAAITTTTTQCSECPIGTGVAKLCNTTTTTMQEDTQCEPCVAGSTFSDASSRHAACRSCRVCPENSRVRRECNVTHDTECECERDFYQEMITAAVAAAMTSQNEDEGGVNSTVVAAEGSNVHHARHHHGEEMMMMTCRACDLCPHGYGAARACSSTHNTVCRKCPASTYSSVLSASHGCSVCTVCRDDQVTLHECTPIMDTVCADKDMGHPSRRIITKPLEPSVQQQEADEYNNEGIISVYCAILGAIVLGLLIYVVMKQWRLRKAANKLAHFEPRSPANDASHVPLNGNSPPPAAQLLLPPPPHYLQHHREEISPSGSRRLPLDTSDGSRGSRGSDSEFHGHGNGGGGDGHNNSSSRELKPITRETRLRDICTSKRREMESMLNGRRDHHDWKALARDLGYTSTRIASLEQRAIEKQTGGTRQLFADWAKRDESTVNNLVASLCNIGRHDVTLVIVPFIQESPPRSTAAAATAAPHTLPRTAISTGQSSRSYKHINVV